MKQKFFARIGRWATPPCVRKCLTSLKALTLLLVMGLSMNVWGATSGDVFSKITSISDLADGDEIIFVSQDEKYACGTTQNTNNRSLVSISTNSSKYTYASGDNVQVFVVKKNTDERITLKLHAEGAGTITAESLIQEGFPNT